MHFLIIEASSDKIFIKRFITRFITRLRFINLGLYQSIENFATAP